MRRSRVTREERFLATPVAGTRSSKTLRSATASWFIATMGKLGIEVSPASPKGRLSAAVVKRVCREAQAAIQRPTGGGPKFSGSILVPIMISPDVISPTRLPRARDMVRY